MHRFAALFAAAPEWYARPCAREFDVTGVLCMPADAPVDAVRLHLHWHDASNHWTVGLSPTSIRLTRTLNGTCRVVGESAWTSRDRVSVPLRVKRRSGHITAVAGGSRVAEFAAAADDGGKLGRTLSGEALLDRLRLQKVGDQYFTDDFMRTESGIGLWESETTNCWGVEAIDVRIVDPARSANPYSYMAQAGAEPAVTGYTFWDSYLFSAAIRPEATGTVGLVFFHQDARNMCRFECSLTEGVTRLVWLTDGKRTVAASSTAAFQTGQWYRLTVRAVDTNVQAYVDGRLVISADSPPFCSGRVGLLAQTDGRTVFDDVLCRSWRSPADDLSPLYYAPEIADQFRKEASMAAWADPENDWEAGTNDWRWHKGRFWGDALLAAECAAPSGATQAVELMIHAREGQPDSGYRLALVPSGPGVASTLHGGGKTMQSVTIPAAELDGPFVLWRHAGKIIVKAGRRCLLSVDDTLKLKGTRSGVRVKGLSLPAASLTATGSNVIDDTFGSAPTRWWQGRGEWRVRNRWKCRPGWTWIVGTGDEVPMLWTKTAFGGDFVAEAFLANRMDLPGWYSHPGNLNVTVCGDGASVDSGYNCVYACWTNTASGLFRSGKACAPRNRDVYLRYPKTQWLEDYHRHWFHVRVERQANRLRHWVEGQLVSEFEDPNPIPHGRFGLWTQASPERGGGLVVARSRVWFEKTVDTPLPDVRLPRPVCGLPWHDPAPVLREYDTIDFGFGTPGDTEGWVTGLHMGEPTVSNGVLRAQITGYDPYVMHNCLRVAADRYSRLRIRMRIEGPISFAQFFWATDAAVAFHQDRHVSFRIQQDKQFHEYVLDLSRRPDWKGQGIRGIRIDPTHHASAVGTFVEIDYVRGE